jgi:hypothetical protein
MEKSIEQHFQYHHLSRHHSKSIKLALINVQLIDVKLCGEPSKLPRAEAITSSVITWPFHLYVIIKQFIMGKGITCFFKASVSPQPIGLTSTACQ